MSGDVQPRKRKDKKKKKEDSDEGISIPGKTSTTHTTSLLGEDDSIIHIHHEGGTGGHWCAKIVFFALLAVLVFLVGLILVENRGLTDLDVPASESRYAELFDGWVDEGPFHDDHHDEHTLELKHEDGDSHEDEHDDEHEDVEYLEEEHGHTDDEHSDGEEDEAYGTDDEAHDDDDEQSQEYLEHDDDDDTGEDDEDEAIHEIDYNGDEADDDDDEYLGDSNENDDDDDNTAEDDDDDDVEQPLEEVDSNEEDVVDNSAGEEELLAAKKAEQLAHEEEDSGVGMRVGIGLALVVIAYCVLARKICNASPGEDDETDGSLDLNRRMTLIENEEAEEEEKDEEEEEEELPPPPVVKKASALPLKFAPPPKQPSPASQSPPIRQPPSTVQSPLAPPQPAPRPPSPISPEAARIRQVIQRYVEGDDEEETKEPVKEPVQEKKPAPLIQASKTAPPTKQESTEEDVEEITKEEIQNLEADYEYDDEEEEEELEDEEEVLDEEEIEEEEIVEEDDISDDADDTELLKKLEAKYGKLPQQDEDQAEGRSDDEPPPAPARKKGKTTGGNALDDEEHEEWVDDTSNDHWKEQLELAQAEMEEGHLDKAYRQFTALSLTYKTCPLAKLGRARTLDAMAEAKRSNPLLDKAIDAYREILDMKNLKNKLFREVSTRTITQMRFRGKYLEAVPVHNMLVERFPNNVTYRNDHAITYLMVNKVDLAREVLKDTLTKWPNDGIALVHYGFILKTEDNNYKDSIKYMQKGIDVGGNATMDGRFLFHLGDAYARLGNQKQANKIYELGASVGIFLSPLQRSLYNVNRLTGRPWWEPEQTPYGKLFEDLVKNWKEIAKEAKRLHPAYEPEHENLKDKGDWSQFPLFIRGRESKNNCQKCPITCAIVKKESSAWNCRRGQIKFSAMQPGTHVFAHTGPTNCRIRAHLGLTGTSNTYIRVGKETRSWEIGKVFIFDDSFEHEVWHNGTELRIVLIVDLWHPELTREERVSLPAI